MAERENGVNAQKERDEEIWDARKNRFLAALGMTCLVMATECRVLRG